MYELEPYLFDLALEILKILGGVMIPFLTMLGIMYKRKFERQLKLNEIDKYIARYTNNAVQLKSFKSKGLEGQMDMILEDIKPFVIDIDIVISDTELRLMIERALTMPKSLKYRLMKEQKNEFLNKENFDQ